MGVPIVDSVQQSLLSLQASLSDFGIGIPYEVLQLYSTLATNIGSTQVALGFLIRLGELGLGTL